MTGWGHGHGVIMDKHYRVVKSVEPASYQSSSDMHEFRLINDGKSALVTQYLRSVHDLCPYDLCDGLGYINQGAFQEIDVETGDKLFEWRSIDHVGLDESYVLPGTTEISGSGEQPGSPWDYFHINSIDKNEAGDYLISARHVSALYKISGKDGHVIWRLNGAKSDYYLDGFRFSFQHDARWISDNEDETVVSIFDNGSNGFNQTQPHSTLQIIRLNHRTKVATADLNLDPPFIDGYAHISKSQGNFQRLENGNIVAGWGNDAFWTEYSGDDHEIVFYGLLGVRNVMNYRVHKFNNWVGLPLTKPAMWTYSKSGMDDGSMSLYVSWNGATEVRDWRFWGSKSKDGPWETIVTAPKNGFETIQQHDRTYLYTYAEALDSQQKILGTSEVQRTYVPESRLREYCDDLACRFMPTGQQRDKERKKKEKEQRQKEEKEASARNKFKHEAIIFGSSFGALTVIAVIAVVLATNNLISRPIRAFAWSCWDRVRQRGKYEPTAQYKALNLEDTDGDRTPMITDGS